MSVLIPLTKGFEAIVDDADAEMILRHKWFANVATRKGGRTVVYAVRNTSRKEPGLRQLVALHRQIMCPGKDECVDHIDYNGLNNQRSNLRVATTQQNVSHKFAPHGQHGFLGVWKRGNRFRARIDIDRKPIYSSISYATVEEAALARDAMSLKYFGEFALLNFPPETPPIAMHEDLAKGPPVCRSSVSPKTLRSETHRATDELVPAKPAVLDASMSLCRKEF